MTHAVLLTGSKNPYCTIETANHGASYLNCTIERSSHPSIKPPVISGSRPPICEIPGAIHEPGRNNGLSPLDTCAYKYGSMSHCGCPTLDPKKNTQLWEKYVDSAIDIVLQNLKRNSKEITLTFFASGYLLQDCELISRIFNLETLKNWSGNLNLQFIDLKYEIGKIESLKNPVSPFNTNEGMNWKLLAGAIICGTVGVGAIYGGTKQEKKEHKYACMGVGTILIIVALILGIQSAPQKGEEKKLGGSHSVSQIKMKDSVEGAVKEFLDQMAVRLPEGISLCTSFFPSAEACVEKGKATDAILGYDIDDSFNYFESVRKNILKENGRAVLVIKMMADEKRNVPIFLTAKGPEVGLQSQKI